MAQVITKAEFSDKVLKQKGVVLVDFFATWCGPCQALIPVIDELSKEIGNDAKIYKVDVDESPELASEYGVMSIPSLKLFKGGKIVDETIGAQPKAKLLEMIKKNS